MADNWVLPQPGLTISRPWTFGTSRLDHQPDDPGDEDAAGALPPTSGPDGGSPGR